MPKFRETGENDPPNELNDGNQEELTMERASIKRGRVENVGSDQITIFSHEGRCEDTFAILPDNAEVIRGDIGIGKDVFYLIDGSELLAIGLEESASDELRFLYENTPREAGCVRMKDGPTLS
jgi:hypothetical protein